MVHWNKWFRPTTTHRHGRAFVPFEMSILPNRVPWRLSPFAAGHSYRASLRRARNLGPRRTLPFIVNKGRGLSADRFFVLPNFRGRTDSGAPGG